MPYGAAITPIDRLRKIARDRRRLEARQRRAIYAALDDGYSQSEIASAVGLTQQGISKIKRARERMQQQ